MDNRSLTTINVPQLALMDYYEPQIRPVPGKVGILIVTHRKDFNWLHYCLRAINKFASGFSALTVVLPTKDNDAFEREFKPELERTMLASGHRTNQLITDCKIHLFDEHPTKGFLHHALQICCADLIMPSVSYVAHFDSDCILKEPTDAGHYFEGGKPVMVWRPYSSMPTSDCCLWKEPVERALKISTDVYSMCRHPAVLPTALYPKVRDFVAGAHGVPFDQFVLAQRNEMPMGFAEFPLLGAFAWEFMRDSLAWRDCSTEPVPRDKMKVFWSHAGVRQFIDDGFMNGKPMREGLIGKLTFQDWAESILA